MNDTARIRFECPHCESWLRVAATAAGKRIRCPKCTKIVEVPPKSDIAEERVDSAARRTIWPWFAGGGAVLLLLVGLGFWVVAGIKDRARIRTEQAAAETRQEEDRIKAEQVAAEKEKEENLIKAAQAAAEKKKESERLKAAQVAAEKKKEEDRKKAEQLAAEKQEQEDRKKAEQLAAEKQKEEDRKKAEQLAAEKKKGEDKKPGNTEETLRQRIAKVYPDLESQWVRIGKGGSLNEFLAFKESKDAKGLVSLTPFRRIADVYLDGGLRPWMSFTEDTTKARVVPGGWVNLSMLIEFDVPGHNQQVTGTVSDITLMPKLVSFRGPGSHTSILRGFKGPTKTEVSALLEQRSIWVQIPKDTVEKEIQVSISAETDGHREGVVKKQTDRKKITVSVERKAQPTRENIFCLWERAVAVGDWLGQFAAGDPELKKMNQRYLDWSHSYLLRFAETKEFNEAALAKEAMQHDLYKKHVSPRASK